MSRATNAKLTLDADIPFDKGVLRVLSGGDRIQLLQDDVEVTKYEFTGKTELAIKAVKGSALDGVEFQWEVEGAAGKRTAKLTVVEGTLEIYSKSDAKIGSKQRVIHKAKSRAKVVVSCQPKEWAGQLELESASQKVKLFTNSIGPFGEGEKRQVAASDTPKTFYVQGLETSGALWDTGLKLHLVGLANGVDEAKITVIETSLEVSKPYAPTAVVGRDAQGGGFRNGSERCVGAAGGSVRRSYSLWAVQAVPFAARLGPDPDEAQRCALQADPAARAGSQQDDVISGGERKTSHGRNRLGGVTPRGWRFPPGVSAWPKTRAPGRAMLAAMERMAMYCGLRARRIAAHLP